MRSAGARWALLAALVTAGACGSGPATGDAARDASDAARADTGAQAGADAGADARSEDPGDAASDLTSTPDAASDDAGGLDARTDAQPDVATDAAGDAPADAPDAPADRAPDVAADAGPDAPTDRGPDVPSDAPATTDAPANDASDASDATGGTDACTPRRCGIEIMCGVAADGCGDSVTCDPCPDVGRTLRLPGARHMVVDHARNLIYVTIPASNTTYPNSVLIVAPTPTAPKVMMSIPVGADPNVLALSDDGSRLWVGVDGEWAIRNIDFSGATPVVSPLYKLPGGFNYPYMTKAGAMRVLHGNGSSVIVALASVTEIMGLVVIDNGVPRTAAMRNVSSALAVGRNDDVFGANGRSTAYDFFHLPVSAQGVAPAAFPRLLTNFTRDLVFGHDRVYSEGGDVIQVATPTAPVNLGKLPSWGSPRPLPDDPTRVLLLAGGPANGNAILRMVDATTLTAKAMVSLAGVTGYYTRDLDVVGRDSIAFITEELTPSDTTPNYLVVARTSLLP